MILKKINCLVMVSVLLCSVLISACQKNEETSAGNLSNTYRNTCSETSADMQIKDSEECVSEGNMEIEMEEKEAESDCRRVMAQVLDIYEHADKGEASNVVLSDETIFEMQNKLKKTGCPVYTAVRYSNMENYEQMEQFLKACTDGESASIVTYEIHYDGGIARRKYIFDGTDMHVLAANAVWNDKNEPLIAYMVYNGVKAWSYTDKGWFRCELCVPEPPEVSEIVDGSYLVRIRPLAEEQREMSEKCVAGLGYQGNNLLCSNWDADHMENLDYNGLYEYLYQMKYHERFNGQDYPNGIPKDEFESLVMEYLPVTSEQLQTYAVFDEMNQTYAWARLGCFNYTLNFFGTSIPEVTDIRENEDGTVTLTVEAVCDTVICDDGVITHALTVRFSEDGHFQYLGNEILNGGIQRIPQYQYRVGK